MQQVGCAQPFIKPARVGGGKKSNPLFYILGIVGCIVLTLIIVGAFWFFLGHRGPLRGNLTSCTECCAETIGRLEDIQETLDEFLEFGEDQCHGDAGVFDIESRFPLVDAEYDRTIRFDNIRGQTDPTDPTRTNITYFPGLPGVSPTNNLPVLVGNHLDHTRFKAFQGNPYSIGFFFNVSYFDVEPTSRLLSVLDRNIEDRGPNNLELRRVMAALTREKIVCRYNDRILTFVQNVYDSWVVHREPVLSSFKNHLINFYLDIMLGTADHPDFVKKYFDDWLFFISTIDSDDVAEVRTKSAHIQNQCVREYFESRILDVMDESKTDTIVYHWMKSGMPLESVITEGIRAITSFGPLVNAVYLAVNQSINKAASPGTCFVSFLELFDLASQGIARAFIFTNNCQAVVYSGSLTPEQIEINVIREFIRLTVPDPLTVSTDTGNTCVGCSPHTSARHSAQLIEIRAEYDRAVAAGLINPVTQPWTPAPTATGWIAATQRFGAYNPVQYANFTASYANATCNDTCSACLAPSDRTPGLLASINSFTVSPVDGETQLPAGEGSLIPVFQFPIYANFGLGARRNPYEILIQYTLLKLFEAIKCLQFINVCPAGQATPACNPNSTSFVHPLIPLAPLVATPDSFFVNPTTPFRQGCVVQV